MPKFPETLKIMNVTEASDYALRQSIDENWMASKERFDHVGLSLVLLAELNRRSTDEVNRLVLKYTRASLLIGTIGIAIALIALFRR